MGDRIAAALSRAAIRFLVRSPLHPVGGQFGFRAMKAYSVPRHGSLCGSDRREAQRQLSEFLGQCRQRRNEQFQPKRDTWETRPTWNGRIVNSAQVNTDVGRARCAVTIEAPAWRWARRR